MSVKKVTKYIQAFSRKSKSNLKLTKNIRSGSVTWSRSTWSSRRHSTSWRSSSRSQCLWIGRTRWISWCHRNKGTRVHQKRRKRRSRGLNQLTRRCYLAKLRSQQRMCIKIAYLQRHRNKSYTRTRNSNNIIDILLWISLRNSLWARAEATSESINTTLILILWNSKSQV